MALKIVKPFKFIQVDMMNRNYIV